MCFWIGFGGGGILIRMILFIVRWLSVGREEEEEGLQAETIGGGAHNKLVAYRFPKKQGLRGDLWALYSVKIRMLCDPESLTHIAITLSALLGPKPHI